MENTQKEELISRIRVIENHKVINSIDNFLNTIDNLMNHPEPYEDNPYLDRIPQTTLSRLTDEASTGGDFLELNMQWLKYW